MWLTLLASDKWISCGTHRPLTVVNRIKGHKLIHKRSGSKRGSNTPCGDINIFWQMRQHQKRLNLVLWWWSIRNVFYYFKAFERNEENCIKTNMHSSRMCTNHLLTVSLSYPENRPPTEARPSPGRQTTGSYDQWCMLGRGRSPTPRTEWQMLVKTFTVGKDKMIRTTLELFNNI